MRREIKGQTIGAQALVFSVIFAVHFVESVFTVAQKRMPDGGKMRADLMGASGDQITLDERQLAGFPENAVFCDGRAGAFDL